MTPANIAGMGVINGLQIMALTDHNTAGNCPAFCKACRRHGIIPIAGMELTTAEDIHMVCLFPELEEAMAFDGEVKGHIMNIKNRPDIFGHQYYMDEEDKILGEEETLLISATDYNVETAIALVHSYNGVCYPAHIDRVSNGMVATLGDIPMEYGFNTVEFNDSANAEEYKEKYKAVKDARILCSSDAHYLWDINEAKYSIMIEDEPYSSAYVRSNLLKMISGK